MSADKEICSRCGKIHLTHWGHPACVAHRANIHPLEPCTKHPKNGMKVCRSHGGALPANIVAATERLALMSTQGQIADLMRECDIPDQHPIEGLLDVVRVTGSMVRLLTVKVGELQEEPTFEDVLVEGSDGSLSIKKVPTGDAFWGVNHEGEMVPHIYVQLLKTWSERFERACKTALDAGVAERQVRLAESEGELVATAIKGILSSLNLTPEQWSIAPKVVAAQLRQIS